MSKSKKEKRANLGDADPTLGIPEDIKRKEKRACRRKVRATLNNIRSLEDIDEDDMDEFDDIAGE